MPKIVVMGKSGFLGSYLNSIDDDYLQITGVGREECDLSKPLPLSFLEFLSSNNFNYAVICAAITDIEKCYKEQSLSQLINVTRTIELLHTLKQNDIVPIFFSSDYVFRPSAYPLSEDDERSPTTIYGKQKLAVEQFIEKNFDKFLIFRTSKLMSKSLHSKNILFPIIQALSQGKHLKCFNDQWINPVFIEDIGEVLRLSVHHQLSGAFHLGTKNILTRYQLAKLCANELALNSELIQASSLSEALVSELRPSHNVLNCSKIESALTFKFTEVNEVVKNLGHLS